MNIPASTSTGLARAKEIYADREGAARQLKAEGREIMGYLCAYPPLEIITALGYVPFRVLGSMDEPITKADEQLPAIICPILRSQLDLGLKGKYDFLDGFVGAHTCDCAEKYCHIWNYNIPSDYRHFIDLPHIVHKESREFYKEGLEVFQKTLEEHAGKKLDPERLREEIELHNRQRALVRELYDLRKPEPPLISGSENLQVMIALMSMPIDQGNKLIEDVIAEVKGRKERPKKKQNRLLVWGTPMTQVKILEMIESLEANVVMDDMCVGSRHFWPDVRLTEDLLDGIARRYLTEIRCPRTFLDPKGSYEDDLEARFNYLKGYARDWKVNAVVLQSVKYCDTHGYEVPILRDYFEGMGLPSLYLEHEYSLVATAPLQTRVEAFLETIA